MNHLAVLIIGNEILSGKVQDANACFVIEELKQQGGISKVEIVPDDRETIKEAVVRLSTHYEFVITSGGVGPTHDDITIPSIAEAFGVLCKHHDKLANAIQNHFKEECNEALLSMALVPEGTEVIYQKDHSFPICRFKNIFILPGIPEYFHSKFLAIKPLLLRREIFLQTIYTTLYESQLAKVLTKLEERFKSLRIGSYPKLDKDYKVMVTFESPEKEVVNSAIKEFKEEIPFETLVSNPDNFQEKNPSPQ